MTVATATLTFMSARPISEERSIGGQSEVQPRPEKLELLETARELTDFRSFADLGACWGVDGAYAFHAAALCGKELDRAVIVDGHLTALTRERAKEHPRVDLVEALLGSQQALEAVDQVDALVMFDILLHQVDPDWDRFLLNWLPSTNVLIVFNQNWLKTPRTIRFVDRGVDWCYENVYVWEDEWNTRARLESWFERHHERDENGRLERDNHWYWQFGIRPLELINLLAKNGFELVYMKRHRHAFGRSRPWIVNDGLIFQRAAYPEQGVRGRLRAAARSAAERTGLLERIRRA